MAPDALPAPLEVLGLVAAVLDRLGVPYLVAGSLASSFHGEPRATDDLDLVIDLVPAQVARLTAALEESFYVDADVARKAATSGGAFNAIHLATAVKVDLFVAAEDPLDRERLRRRIRAKLPDLAAEIFVDTAEDTILRKLEWYRRGGEVSERQWRDVIGVLRVQGDRMDRSHLETWARRLGFSDLLSGALEEAAR
jgi:hypothetical protein